MRSVCHRMRTAKTDVELKFFFLPTTHAVSVTVRALASVSNGHGDFHALRHMATDLRVQQVALHAAFADFECFSRGQLHDPMDVTLPVFGPGLRKGKQNAHHLALIERWSKRALP